MRVTNGATYRNFTTGANNVHAQLIKSYNKVSSGEAYEKASDSPLNYYNSQKIDSRYQDVIGKQALIKDVQNRIRVSYPRQKTRSSMQIQIPQMILLC